VARYRTTAGRLAFRYVPSLLPLRRLGGYHGTQKARIEHLGRTYLDVYELYLRGWRRKRFALLELGVYRGESLRMWQSYFRRARVYGLDVDPAAASRVGDSFRVFVGSQGDAEFLSRVADDIGPDLRLVVDDASHVNELTIASFDALFPRLPPGSLYAIEDLAPGSYEAAWASWPGMEYNDDVSLENRREDFDAFLLELCHDSDGQGSGRWGEDRAVAFVHAWPALVVVGRA
jgi:hypothetical protein